MKHTAKTFCRNCTSHCGLSLEVEDNRIIGVRGDATHAMTAGYFCVKANRSVEFATSPERVTQCLKRDADGALQPVAADTAYDEIAAKLRTLVDKHGPRSIGIFYGTGSYFNGLGWPLMKSFIAELGSPNLFSTMTIDQSARWVSVLRMGMMASGSWEPGSVDTLLIVGKNPVVSHQLIGFFRPSRSLSEMRARGGEVIVIDPRATETTRHASLHLPVVAGEDVTLLSGMIRLILERGWHDAAFCERFGEGLDVLRAAVAPYTPEFVEQRAGIAPAQLTAACEKFACAPKSLAVAGTGPCMTRHSNLVIHLLDTLNVICGNFRRAGDIVENQSVLMPRAFAATAVPPKRTWERGVQCRSSATGQLFGELPSGALPDEILMPGDDRIRALIVLGGNPVTAIGQPDKTLRAFADLELLVTIDPRITETARLAHYVIPPKLQYERHDLPAVMDCTAGYTHPFVQYAEPVVAAPPGAVDEGEFFWQIARRLGLQLRYKKMILGVDYHNAGPGQIVDMQTMPEPDQFARWWCEGTAVDLETLKANPSGYSVPLPETRVLEVEDSGARIALCPADIAAELDAVVHEAPDAGYRYRLITRRVLECLNSLYAEHPETRKRYAVNYAYMHPADMSKENCRNDDRVRIESPHGAVLATARAEPTLRPGTIAMTHQWGEPDLSRDPLQASGALTARLVSLDADIEPINRMPRQSAIAVNVSLAHAT